MSNAYDVVNENLKKEESIFSLLLVPSITFYDIKWIGHPFICVRLRPFGHSELEIDIFACRSNVNVHMNTNYILLK